MQRLSEEIVKFFKTQGFVIVSTIDPDGMPHHSCKDIIRISPDGRVYLLDLYLRRTFENLKANQRMAIVAVDEHKFMGYSLQGKGKIVRADRLKGQVTKLWLKKITSRITSRIIRNLREEKGHPRQPESLLPMPQYMIVMEVDKIIDLTPAHLK